MSQHPDTYAAQGGPEPTRRFPDHGTISPSARPGEDWTKISDLAERRRIQNRISQRRYRKRIKERLEEQARLSGYASSSGNEHPSPSTKTKRDSKRPTRARPTLQSQGLFHTFECKWSDAPPTFASSTYLPHPEEMIIPSDGSVPGYQPMPTEMYPDPTEMYPEYLSLPAVLFSDAIEPETMGEFMLLFMSDSGYPIPGVNLGAEQPLLYDQTPHTPPLSHSYDHSAASSDSESYNNYSTTPLSTPGLPGVVRYA